MHDVIGQEIIPGCVIGHATIRYQSHFSEMHVCIVREVIEEKGVRTHQLIVDGDRITGGYNYELKGWPKEHGNFLVPAYLKKPEALLVTRMTEQQIMEQYQPKVLTKKEWIGY